MKNAEIYKLNELKHVTKLVAYLLIVWGFYRFIFKFPEEIEELVIKPLIWLTPVLYFVFKVEKKDLASLGFVTKNIFPSIYMSLGLGAFFVIESLFINYMKYGGLNFAANIGSKPFLTSLGLSFATAFTEEITFRGYIFARVLSVIKKEWVANISTSLLWASIHVPVAVFVWKLDFLQSVIYLVLTTIFGIGSAFIYARTKNITSSVLLHVLWEWPIILFR